MLENSISFVDINCEIRANIYSLLQLILTVKFKTVIFL